MTTQIVESLVFVIFTFFVMFISYSAGNEHGEERGFKRGLSRGKILGQNLQNESSAEKYVKSE